MYVVDPGHGLVRYTRKEFSAGWLDTNKADERKKSSFILKLLERNREQTERIRELEEENARLRGEPPVKRNFLF